MVPWVPGSLWEWGEGWGRIQTDASVSESVVAACSTGRHCPPGTQMLLNAAILEQGPRMFLLCSWSTLGDHGLEAGTLALVSWNCP